jgi:hypothetical protein
MHLKYPNDMSLLGRFNTILDYVLAGKPNSKHDSADGTEDGKRDSFPTNNSTNLIFSW